MTHFGSSSRDFIKSLGKENSELAEQLLCQFQFPVDRAKLLTEMVSFYFFLLRRGNKREERAAYDFLNELQRIAKRIHEQGRIGHS